MTLAKNKVVTWLMAMVIACALALVGVGTAFAADQRSSVDLGEPVHTKTLTSNGDGTYNLTLDVTGKSQASQEKTKANVIVILDTSGSMGNDTYVYTPTTENGRNRYGLVDGEYVSLTRDGNSYYYNNRLYEGTLYERSTTDRLSVAQDAVNNLADELLGLNEEGEGTVEMALVTFSNSATVQSFSGSNWTTNYDAFKDRVDGLNDNGGTNWEDALAKANGITGDGDPTYVIFVSDGNPTFRVTAAGYNDYSNTYKAYGTGQETDQNVSRCYEQAKDDAKAIVDAGKSFYAIGAFGDVDRMGSLLSYAYDDDEPDNHYFDASDQEGLESAFAAIIADINKSFTYTDVSITDEITGLTATGIDGDTSDFVYMKNGEIWADAPAASFDEETGTVVWNLGDGYKLENGVTYSVSFKVWPNQEAYDTVAGLTNGTIEWDAEAYPNIVKNEDGTYSVYSNESATLAYKQVDTVNGKDTVGEEKTALYERPLMPVPVSTLNIVKNWENAPAGFTAPAIEVVVNQDGEEYQTVTLNAGNDWSTDLVVPAGPEGHVYSLKEITELGNGWTTTYGDSVKLQGFVALASGFAVSLTNTYEADPVTLPDEDAINVQKILVGRDWKDSDEFQFELSAVTEGAPMPGATVVTVKNDTPLSFGEITFTEAGTYKYQVTEIEGSIPGVSYDQTIRTVTVVVTDNGKGQLEAVVDYGSPELNAAVFTNIYGANAVDLALAATKVLEGREWNSTDEFEFVLVSKDGAPVAADAKVSADKDNQTVSFGDITFDKPGDYEFVITETAGDIPGVTYSDEVFTVLVSVVDDTEGSLKVANLAYKNSAGEVLSAASFKNTYKADPVIVGGETALEATKKLEGRDWAADDVFTAVLSPVDGAPMPEDAAVELTASKQTVAFGDIEFTKAGTYKYTITETKGNLGGVTYDETVYNVTITVTDDGEGHLVAEVEYDNAEGAVFTNVYEADDVTLEGETALKVQKVLQGRDWMKGDEFAFTISAKTDNAPMPADKKVVVADGNVASFGEITFTEAGTYVYEISEDKGILGGILYDEAVYTVTVYVTDNGEGQLVASVDYGIEGATAAVFTNVYGADDVTLEGETALKASKVLTGRDWAEGDAFEFVLAGVDGAPMPESNTVTAYDTEAVSFGAITFTEEGEYTYTISEKPGSIEGITYDTASYTVTVKVEDDKQGNLVATVTYMDENEQAVNGAVFTNKYAADSVIVGPEGDVALQAQKDLTGRDWKNTDKFQFTLAAVGNAPMPENATVTVTDESAVSFGNIVFNSVGTYEYTITEVAGEIGGVTYDDTEYPVTVTVTDNGKGKLVAEVSYGEGVEIPVFTNVYEADPVAIAGESSVNVQKVLVGRDWKGSDEFQFELTPVTEGAPLPENNVVSVKNDTPVSFGEITFTEAGTYEYQVVEVKGSIPGVSYDQTIRTVFVTVTDNGEGKLEASVDYGMPELNAAVFTNIYGANAVDLALAATKVLEGREWSSTDEFEFVLVSKDGVPVAADAEVSADKDNQTVSFGDITFDEVGDYEFVISETAGDIPGVTYSDEVFTVLVSIADDTEGQLYVANLVYKNSAGFAFSGASFKNTYKADSVTVDGKTSLEVTKKLEGRDWTSDDEFEFVLTPKGNAPAAEQAKVVANEENQTVSFGDITFDKAGTYEYVVTETQGSLGGVTYDATEYPVTIEVTDNGEGKLEADVSFGEAEAIEFTNVYEADDVTLEGETALKVQKVLDGREWMEGDEFTFSIDAKTDNTPLPADKKVSVTDGSVVNFDAITFTEAGTYVYEISEDKGILGGILYDERVYEVTVVVTDDGVGQLHASVSYGIEGATAAVFTNTYGADDVTLEGGSALKASKVLTGRDWAEDDAFEFVLAAVTEGAPMPEADTVVATSADAVNFGAITFEETGEYEYTITEKAGTIGGVIYDETVYEVTVTVEDDKKGNLVATVAYAVDGEAVNAAVFTNKYSADEVVVGKDADASIEAAKVLEGRDWMDGDAFTFQIEAVTEGSPMPADNTVVATSSDVVAFADITFDKAGEYQYTVSEVAGKIGGVTYDETVYNVTVTVTDNGKGNLVAEVSYDEGVEVPTFINVYDVYGDTSVDTVDFGLTKELTGREWTDEDSFEFQIEAVTEGAPMPEATTATVSENGGTIDFGAITYDAAELPELPATFEYEITEIAGEAGGVGYDNHVVTVKVIVTDQMDGTIHAAATIVGEKVFTNVYDVTPAELPFTIQKTLDGHDMAADQFEFTVEPQDSDSAEKLASATVKNPAASDGVAAAMPLGNLTFGLADAGKTFTYEVSEVQEEAAGYTYDDAVHTVEFVVADGGKGALDVTILVDGEEVQAATVDFTNVYRADGVLGAEGEVAIEANKTLEGQALSAGEFTFSVKDANGNEVATGTNDADGSITFTDIEYTTESVKADVAAGLATENADGAYVYTYQVVENTEGLAEAGITPTVSSFAITVVVTDDGEGNLVPAVQYPEGTDSLEFVNAYGTNEAQLVITGAKALSAEEGLNPPDITGKFTFALTGENADGLTATNDAAGNVVFPAITYTTEDLEGVEADENNVRTAVFEYTVTESGVVEGIINDGKKTFTVTVTDDGKGNLTAVPDGKAQFVFTNIYTVVPEEAPVIPQFSMLKTLEGRDMVDGEFEFQMTNLDGGIVSTGTNRADGTIVMSPITFSKPGTYVYLVSEVAGELGGVTYDPTVFTMTAEVTDKSNGTLEVAWSVDSEDGIIFENAYAAAPTAIQFGALKLLDGRDLAAGEFEFELTNEGTLMSVATNDADGAVEFEPVVFEEEGTYVFQISEVSGNAEGVTYDETVYEVEVVVTDDLNGNLQPEVTFVNGEPIFTNKYVEPKDPAGATGAGDNGEGGEPGFAQTNDATPFGFFVVLACAAAVCAVVAKRRASN